MPSNNLIPLTQKVPDYDATLTGKLISYVENPDSVGYKNGLWYSPKYDKRYNPKKQNYDVNNFGMGIDRKENAYLGEGLTFHKDKEGREYLTEEEERNVRHHSIAEAEKSYGNRLAHAQKVFKSQKVPSEMKKALTISAIYNLGQGTVATELFEDKELMNAFLNGTDLEYSNHVNRYFTKYNKGDRGLKTNEFVLLNTDTKKALGGWIKPRDKWDELSLPEQADYIGIAVKNGVYNLADIRKAYNEFAEGGDKKTPEDDDNNKNTKEDSRRQMLMKRGNDLLRKVAENYLTQSNDRTVTSTGSNSHLIDRAVQGAKGHAAWEKEHPVLTQWGTVLGATPLAVATAPAATALGDAIAATSVGKAVTSGLTGLFNSTSNSTFLPWADAAATSYFGIHGLSQALEGNITPETLLEVAPMTRVSKPVAKGVKSAYDTGKAAINSLIDEGTVWDSYTTLRGRVGNYGDNFLTNAYGTIARNYSIPDKARIPADAIRKIGEDVRVENGLINLTGNQEVFGNPHINVTLDRPVVSHGAGQWDGADTYIFPTKNFLEKTKGHLKSIEPSDMFANGVKYMEEPENVTLISGDVKALEKAKEVGMQTVSSPKLRKLYDKAYKQYEKSYNQYLKNLAETPIENRRFLQKPTPPKVPSTQGDYWPEYAEEVQRLQARRGTPTLEDFRLLEKQTGLNAGVAPLSEYENAVKNIENMPYVKFDDIRNGVIQPYTYPNGRTIPWSIETMENEPELLKRAKYNKVFYDPATDAEFNWRKSDH